MIEVTATAIDAVKLLVPSRRADHRGYLSEVYSERELRGAGIDTHFVADNHVLNLKANVLRGLHFQTPPFEQVKLVRVTRGRVFDVAVDLRAGSPTFGRHVGAVLSAEAGNQLYVPEGFAHGFCALEDGSEVHYKLSCQAQPGHDKGIRWDDPALGIDWLLTGAPILAERDTQHPLLADWQAAQQREGAAPLGTHEARDSAAVIDALEAERCRALLARDMEALQRLCSDRLVYTHTSTRRDTKESFLRRVETGYYEYLEFTRGVPKVTVLGSTAFVNGQLDSRVIVEGTAKMLHNAILTVWVHEQGRWQFAAYQATPIPAVVPT
jgi:dTDP-4-dehydrorhamnose 3,5-epimerase